MIKGLGAIFSNIDERDYVITKFSPQLLDKNQEIPECEAKYKQLHIDDQGSSSLCSAYTFCNKVTTRVYKRTGDYVLFSPAAFYADEDNRIFKGEGMIGRDTQQIGRKTGVLRRDVFPIENGTYEECVDLYNKNKVSYQEQSSPFRVEGFAKLRDGWEIAQYIIQEEVPCWGAFDVYSNISTVGKDGIIPEPSGKKLGGHAVLFHGVVKRNNKRYIPFPNTWGKTWGDSGWGYLPVEMAKEAWGDYDRPPESHDNMPHEIVFFTKDIDATMNTKTIWTDCNNLQLSEHPDAYVEGNKIIVRNGVAAAYVENRLMTIVRPAWEAIGWEVNWFGDYVVLKKGKSESRLRKDLGLE